MCFIDFFENYLKTRFLNKLMIGELFENLPFEMVEQIIKEYAPPPVGGTVKRRENEWVVQNRLLRGG